MICKDKADSVFKHGDGVTLNVFLVLCEAHLPGSVSCCPCSRNMWAAAVSKSSWNSFSRILLALKQIVAAVIKGRRVKRLGECFSSCRWRAWIFDKLKNTKSFSHIELLLRKLVGVFHLTCLLSSSASPVWWKFESFPAHKNTDSFVCGQLRPACGVTLMGSSLATRRHFNFPSPALREWRVTVAQWKLALINN